MSEAQKKRESRLFTARVHVADVYQAIKASMEILSSGCVPLFDLIKFYFPLSIILELVSLDILVLLCEQLGFCFSFSIYANNS